MNTSNHKQYLGKFIQSISFGYAPPIDNLKEAFAYDITRTVFQSTNTIRQFESLFEENFDNTIKYFKNTRVSALDFINEFKDQDWKVQWTVIERLSESFNCEECEEGFTHEAHKAIDNLFTKEAMCDICNESEFENCYFQC